MNNENYERITDDPKFDKTRDSHELRYRIVRGFIDSKDFVVDAGCGTGYGMFILMQDRPIRYPGNYYLGLDKEPVREELQWAECFKVYDFETDAPLLRIGPFQVFAGLETIEHLNDRGVENFVGLAKRSEKWIVISTPIVPNSNPYHKQQFSKEDILNLFVDDAWVPYGYLEQERRYGIFIFRKL